MDAYQTTLRRPVRFHGVGLHSGQDVALEVAPASVGTGIKFLRTDLPGASWLPADVAHIGSTELSTTLGSGSNSIATVEHLLAALAGLGIDNAEIRVNGAEIPILDGSSAPFVEALLTAGTTKVSGTRKLYVVKRPFEVKDGDRLMRVEPDERIVFDCTIAFASRAIGCQTLRFQLDKTSFFDLCASRTFCHVREVEAMRAAGLALGGSLDNAVVVNDSNVINAEGLRTADEFVRHKLLDCIGDLALLGAPLVGRFTLIRNGHGLHARFMRELLLNKADYLTVVEAGAFGDHRPAMPESVQAIAAAAAVEG